MNSFYNVANIGFTDLQKLDMLVHQNGIHHAFAEYAARVCYKSTARAGSSPAFVKKLIDSNHMDVFEHSDFVFWVDKLHPFMLNRYSWTYSYDDGSDEVLAAGSSRVFYEAMENGQLKEWQIMILQSNFSALFGEPATKLERLESKQVSIDPVFSGNGAVIYLLGGFGVRKDDTNFITRATWLIEGVSRNFSHQIVRHRMLSFSQESQRYVSTKKGQWGAIVPKSIKDAGYAPEYNEHYEKSLDLYEKLLASGVNKEDARFVLPTGTETRMVVSGPIDGLNHFFEQRIDSAAQWEIRQVATAMFSQLNALKYGS